MASEPNAPRYSVSEALGGHEPSAKGDAQVSMQPSRRKKVLAVRAVFASLVFLVLLYLALLIGWAVSLAGVATGVSNMVIQRVDVGDTCDSITVDVSGLSFEYSHSLPVQFDDIVTTVSDSEGDIMILHIPGQTMEQGLNNWTIHVDVLTKQPSAVSALINTQLNWDAPAVDATVAVKTGIWTWFGWYFGIDVSLPVQFQSGRENLKGSAGGVDLAGRMRLGPYTSLKKLKAKAETPVSEEDESFSNSKLKVTTVDLADVVTSSAGGAETGGLSVSTAMVYDNNAVYKSNGTVTPGFSVRLDPPLLVQLRAAESPAATVALGATPVARNDRNRTELTLRAALTVGAGEAGALAALVNFFSKSPHAGFEDSMVMGFAVVDAGASGAAGGRCSALHRVLTGVKGSFNYSHSLAQPCRPWEFNHTKPAKITKKKAADEKSDSGKFSLSSLPYKVKWLTDRPAGRNEMVMELSFDPALFGKTVVSGTVPGLQAHVITDGQHSLSMGVLGTVVRPGQAFTARVFLQVANASKSAHSPQFLQRYGASLASAADLCPQGTAGTGPACDACPTGRFAPTDGLLVCIACPPSYYAAADRRSCQPCGIGTRGVNGVCTDCAAGAFNAWAAQRQCYACPVGKFTATTGQAACSNSSPAPAPTPAIAQAGPNVASAGSELPPSAFVAGDRLLSRLLSGEATGVTLRFGGAAASLAQFTDSSLPGADESLQYGSSVLGGVLEGVEVRQTLWNTTAPNATAAAAAATEKHQRIANGFRGGFNLGDWQLKAVDSSQLWGMRQYSLGIPFFVASLLPTFDVGASLAGGLRSGGDGLLVTLGEPNAPLARLGLTLYLDESNWATKYVRFEAHAAVFGCGAADAATSAACLTHQATLSGAMTALLQGEEYRLPVSMSHRGLSLGGSSVRLPRGFFGNVSAGNATDDAAAEAVRLSGQTTTAPLVLLVFAPRRRPPAPRR
jgi:hypothetical protein